MDRKNCLENIVLPLAPNLSAARKFTRLLEELFDTLIPEAIGNDYCLALKQEDYAAAISACAKHFRSMPDFTIPGISANGHFDKQTADDYVEGRVCEVNVDWVFENGEVDHLFNPTETRPPLNHEWLWQFNRHSQWYAIARAYRATGDEKYARAFCSRLLGWIAQTDITENWNGPGSAWRTIECGIRLFGSWPAAFDGFKRSPSVSDTVLLLMIASMHRQAVHLANNPTGQNWLMMESNGIYTFSCLFPQLSDAKENRKLAAHRLISELEAQLLPDGMHNELSPDYHGVIVDCASNFYSIALCFGFEQEIPSSFAELLKKTVHSAVLLSTPGFTQPRTNDCHTINTVHFTLAAEKLFGPSPELRFVNSCRTEGHPPLGNTASAFLPYAGLIAMRSNWEADATYMCFDVGPLGTNHMHQDMLNINIYKGDQELIYDDGGGQYEISPAREYGLSAFSHNTVLVDGMGQTRKTPLAYSEPAEVGWVSNEDFDYAAATYSGSFGSTDNYPAIHKREVRFSKPDVFCVSDTLTSADGNRHDYEVLFHLDTTRVKPVPGHNNALISDFRKEYEIVILPFDGENAPVQLNTVSAATEPAMQGWYNGRNEENLHEAITVSRKVCGVKDFRFTTLLIPVKNGDPLPVVSKVKDGKVTVMIGGKAIALDLSALERH
ncbi:MAG: alginate lyase family protein [Clostridia bacterium]|nr:alginate lyase family protein [Clostridia bacterium]